MFSVGFSGFVFTCLQYWRWGLRGSGGEWRFFVGIPRREVTLYLKQIIKGGKRKKEKKDLIGGSSHNHLRTFLQERYSIMITFMLLPLALQTKDKPTCEELWIFGDMQVHTFIIDKWVVTIVRTIESQD